MRSRGVHFDFFPASCGVSFFLRFPDAHDENSRHISSKGKGMLIERLEPRMLLSGNAPSSLFAHPLIATASEGDTWSLRLNRNSTFTFAGEFHNVEDTTGTFTYRKLGANGATLDLV